MKKFKFRLERVLQFRRVVKDEKQRVLLEARRVVEEIRSRIQVLEQELAVERLAREGIMSAPEVMLAAQYVSRLKKHLEAAHGELVGAEDKYQAALAEYIAAAKDEKSLITLKEKKQSAYRELVDKALQEALDERATMVAGRVQK